MWLFVMFVLLLVFITIFLLRADADLLLLSAEKFGSNPECLAGKVIWITGASRGIGASLALQCAKYGAKLVLMARSEELLEDVRCKCIDAGCDANDILTLPNDILDQESHQKLLQKVLDKFGKVSILVSNAGRSQRADWNNIEMSVDRSLFELNVFSLISLARVVNGHFLQSGGGHHAVMSSTAGKIGAPRSASYTASKHALHGYFECLRIEGSDQNIKVTMLCPGPVETNLLQHCFTDKLQKSLNVDRVGKRMSAERCSLLCLYAISNNLPEVWISNQPVILLQYLMQYCPLLVYIGFRFIGLGTVMKLRDGRDNALPTNTKKE